MLKEKNNNKKKNIMKKPSLLGSYGYAFLLAILTFLGSAIYSVLTHVLTMEPSTNFYGCGFGYGYKDEIFYILERIQETYILSILEYVYPLILIIIGGKILYTIRCELYNKYKEKTPKFITTILISCLINVIIASIYMLTLKIPYYKYNPAITIILYIILIFSYIIIHSIRVNNVEKKNNYQDKTDKQVKTLVGSYGYVSLLALLTFIGTAVYMTLIAFYSHEVYTKSCGIEISNSSTIFTNVIAIIQIINLLIIYIFGAKFLNNMRNKIYNKYKEKTPDLFKTILVSCIINIIITIIYILSFTVFGFNYSHLITTLLYIILILSYIPVHYIRIKRLEKKNISK